MSSSTSFIRRCLAAGMPMDMALLAAEAFEAEAPLYIPPPSKAALRQRKWREEKRLRKQQAVTEHNARRQETDVIDQSGAEDARAPVHTRVEDITSTLRDNNYTTPQDASANADDWPAGDAKAHAALLVAEAATIRLDPSRSPALVLTEGRLAAWRRDGASWRFDVVPTVTVKAKARGSPITSWKFFDAAIAQSVANNRQALEIPAAIAPRHERPDQPSAKRLARDDNHARALAGFEAAARMREVG